MRRAVPCTDSGVLHRQDFLTIQPFASSSSAKGSAPVLGLIGGVGSGKSAVAKALANRRNIVVIDGDAAGHQVLLDPHVQQKIRERFGAEVFDPSGAVNRAALGRVVFGSASVQRTARIDLERIVHPQIRATIAQQIEEARRSNKTEAVILDAAVLLEAGWYDLCDAVVFVDTPEDQRRQRVIEGRGWTDEQFRTRESSQLSLEDKRRRSQFCIDNSGSLDESGRQLERILQEVATPRA